MSLTRRRFLEAASVTVLASAAHSIAFAQLPGSKDEVFQSEELAVLDNASEETFKPYIGEKFSVLKGKQHLESMTLLSVKATPQPTSAAALLRADHASKSKRAKETTSGFSLQFKGSSRELEQGTYTIKNESLGSFALFIVPGGTHVNPHTYTATFNLLKQ